MELDVGGYTPENQTLTENNYKLTTAVEEQKETIRVIQENFEKQANALQNMSRKNAEIEAEKQRYLDIFARHTMLKDLHSEEG